MIVNIKKYIKYLMIVNEIKTFNLIFYYNIHI